MTLCVCDDGESLMGNEHPKLKVGKEKGRVQRYLGKLYCLMISNLQKSVFCLFLSHFFYVTFK